MRAAGALFMCVASLVISRAVARGQNRRRRREDDRQHRLGNLRECLENRLGVSTRSVQQARERLSEELGGGGLGGEEILYVFDDSFRRVEARLFLNLRRHSHVQDRTGALIRDGQRISAHKRALEVQACPLIERIDESSIGRRLVFGVGPHRYSKEVAEDAVGHADITRAGIFTQMPRFVHELFEL